jgi:IclR helix-turn-helix domain
MLATAEQGLEFRAFGFAQIDPVAYGHRASPVREAQMNRSCGDVRDKVHRHARSVPGLHRCLHTGQRPPAESDLQRHLRVSPPSVHQMVLTLERLGLVRRQPGVARSIEVLLAPEDLPVLRHPEPVKSSVPRN